MKRYYVYMLIDTRTGAPFYAGKGTASRKNKHTHKLTADISETSTKAVRIKEILADGFEVGSVVTKYFDDEHDALNFERETIDRIGLDNLTNRIEGGSGRVKSDRDLNKAKPVKLTIKQERFVQEYNVDGNGTRAARSAGYKGNDNTLATVSVENLRKPAIAERVTFLQQKFAERCEVTKETIAAELDENRQLAIETMQVGAANGSTLGKAKLFGLLVEKQEVDANHIMTIVTGVPRD